MTKRQFERPPGVYMGQTRIRWTRQWVTKVENARTAEQALAGAVLAMRPQDHSARALLVSPQLREPLEVMRATR